MSSLDNLGLTRASVNPRAVVFNDEQLLGPHPILVTVWADGRLQVARKVDGLWDVPVIEGETA